VRVGVYEIGSRGDHINMSDQLGRKRHRECSRERL
jgi:hypothetical protein